MREDELEGLVQVGDIITSPDFAYGVLQERSSLFHGGRFQVGDKFSGRVNQSRGTSRYVVESTEMNGGGEVRPGDRYPDGWHVTARKLWENDNYNPNGELIEFYQTGFFTCMVKNPTVVGKMQKTFKKANNGGNGK